MRKTKKERKIRKRSSIVYSWFFRSFPFPNEHTHGSCIQSNVVCLGNLPTVYSLFSPILSGLPFLTPQLSYFLWIFLHFFFLFFLIHAHSCLSKLSACPHTRPFSRKRRYCIHLSILLTNLIETHTHTQAHDYPPLRQKSVSGPWWFLSLVK